MQKLAKIYAGKMYISNGVTHSHFFCSCLKVQDYWVSAFNVILTSLEMHQFLMHSSNAAVLPSPITRSLTLMKWKQEPPSIHVLLHKMYIGHLYCYILKGIGASPYGKKESWVRSTFNSENNAEGC